MKTNNNRPDPWVDRPSSVVDITGTRTFTYGALGGLALSKEDLDDTFYGSGNYITHAYEGTGSGRHCSDRENAVSGWPQQVRVCATRKAISYQWAESARVS